MDVEGLVARAEIADVLARYVHAVDRGDWDLLRSCYHADAYDDHGPYKGDVDGLVRFVTGLADRLLSTTHQLGQQLVEVDPPGGVARAETYCLGWYRRRSASTGTEYSVAQGVRYLDLFEHREGRWAIARRTVVMDWEHTFRVTEEARLEDWSRGGRGPSDPSHEFFRSTTTAQDLSD